DDVGDRHARTLRAATRRAVRLAGHAHHAAHALDHEVVTRPLAIRAGMAETGDRAVHEARVQGAQVLVAEAIAPEITILIVLDQHIAAAHELTRNRLTLRHGDVERHRFLAAVCRAEVGRILSLAAFAVAHPRRA